MIELAHLRIIQALAQHETLSSAAEVLCLTQSALSHRMKSLENSLGVALWIKRGQRLILTVAGQDLLRLAQRVLPEILLSEQRLKRLAEGQEGRLYLAVECLPCAQWLNPALLRFVSEYPNVDVNLLDEYRFAAQPALLDYQIDAYLSPDRLPHGALHYELLFEYELCLVVGQQHRLAQHKQFTAPDLLEETLLTYPVERERLDVFTQLLIPAGIEPRFHKKIGDTALMLGMVASGRGVALIPEWLPKYYANAEQLVLLKVGVSKMSKQLWLVIRKEDRQQNWLQRFIALLK